MARTWLSIQVELVEGGGQTFWPRPGRIFAAARGLAAIWQPSGFEWTRFRPTPADSGTWPDQAKRPENDNIR